MLQLRTGSTTNYRSPAQLGAEVVSLINGGAPSAFSSVVKSGQLPQCTVAAEPYGLSLTYADGLKVALQLQFDDNNDGVTEVLPSGRVSVNNGTSNILLTSFALVIGENFLVLSGNVSGNTYTYMAVINPVTADMNGVTTSRVLGMVLSPSTPGWGSIPIMARIANGTQSVQKTTAAAYPVTFPISASRVTPTGVWSDELQDYVRVMPRLAVVSNTGVLSQPANPITVATGAMGWDEQVVVNGVPYKPCVAHLYSGVVTTLLVAQ